MKSLYSFGLILLCIFCSLSVMHGQQSIEFSPSTSPGNPGDIVSSTIRANNFGTPTPAFAYQWGITWDRSVASFSAISNLNPSLAAVPADFIVSLADTSIGQIRVFYTSFVSPVTYSNPSDFFDLELKLESAGTTQVQFASIGSFTIEYNGDPALPQLLNSWEVGGSTPCDGLTDPTLVFGDVSVQTGMQGCIPVYASGLDPLSSFDFFLQFDPTALSNLTLASIYAPLAGDVTFTNNRVQFMNSGGLDVAIPECQALFEVCFDAIGNASTTMFSFDESQAFAFSSVAGGAYTGVMEEVGTITVTGPTVAPTPCDGLTGPTLVFSDTTLVSGMSACIPVYASNLDPLTSFDFFLQYDATALENLSIANIFGPIAGDLTFANDQIQFSNAGGLDVAIPECQALFEVCFDAIGAASTTLISFDESQPFEFASVSGGMYTGVMEVEGTVTLTGGANTNPCDGLTGPTLVFGDTTVVSGMSACVPVYASNLDPLTSFNFFFSFDAAAVSNLSISNIYGPLAGDITFANNGILFSNSGGIDVAIPECQVLFEVCFDAIGPGSTTTIGFDETRAFEFASVAGGTYTGVVDIEGTVTVTPGGGMTTPCDGLTGPTLVFGDTTVVTGMSACVPVYASNLDPLTSFNFFFSFDAAAVSNLSISNIYGPLAGDLTFANNGVLYSNSSGIDVAIPECQVLFEVCFDAIGPGSTTTIGFDETRAFEFASVAGGTYVGVVDTEGTVTVTPGGGATTPCGGLTGPTVVFGDTTIMTGMSACVPVYASNLDPITSFNFFFSFDATAVSNLSISSIYGPLAGDITFANNGILYSNSGGIDIAIPECQILFEVCFDAIGPGSTTTIGFDETRAFEFASVAGGTYAGVVDIEGTVTVTPGVVMTTPCDGFTGPTLVFGDTTVVTGMSACVPVYASNLDPITSFNFFFSFDATAVSNLSISSIYGPLAGDITFANNGILYSNSGGIDIAIPECQILFEVCFDAIGTGSTTTIGFDETRAFEFASVAGGTYAGVVDIEGTVTVTPGVVMTTPCDGLTGPTLVFGDTTVVTGMSACVPVYASNLDPLTSFNFFFSFDAAAVSNLSISNIYGPLAGDLTFANNGVLYSNSSGIDVAIPECQVLFEVCFDAIGPGSTTTIGFDETRAFEFASVAGGIYTGVVDIEGTVTVTPGVIIPAPCDTYTGPTISVDTASGDNGTNVCVSVIGYQLGLVTDFTFEFDTDALVATLTDTGRANALIRAGLTIDATAGAVSFSSGTPVDLNACDTLFTVCFDLIGASGTMTSVDFGATTTVTNDGGGTLSPTQLSGGLTVTGVTCDPIVISETTTLTSCNGDSDGTITLAVTGGDRSYTFAWADGPTTQNRTGLSAGTYMVTVTSCAGTAQQSGSIIVGQPDTVSIGVVQTNVICNGDANGMLDITPMGGNAPYNYTWTGAGILQGFQDQSNLAPGVYSVTVIDDKNCEASASYTITENPVLIVNGTPVSPSPGMTDGSITLVVTGGAGGYTYLWTGAGVIPTDRDQTGLASGMYSVTVTDQDGCMFTRTFTVLEGAPGLSIVTTPTCFGTANGTIDLTITGGTQPFNITWDNGLPAQEDHVNVAAGTYTVTVLDGAGMTSTATATVTNFPIPTVVEVITPSTSGTNGAIDLTVTGGSGSGFTFLWADGPTTEDRTNLAAGRYSVDITDTGNGCTYSEVYDVPVLAQPIEATTLTTAVSCNSANGGICDGTFRLQVTQAVYPITVTFTNGTSVGLPASQIFAATADQLYSGLCPGSFDLLITDAAGLTYVETGIVISEPMELLISGAVITPVIGAGASNGAINISVQGGTPQYRYLWNTGAETEDLAGIPAGSYTVQITDSIGCTLGSSTYIIDQLRVVESQIVAVRCADDLNGSINIEVSGTGPYDYLWSNGATSQDIIGISAGNYTVTVTDRASGASFMETYVVSSQSSISASAQVISNYNGAQISCVGASNGMATASTFGEAGSVTYTWSTNVTGITVGDLSAGTYTVTATDSLGCTSMVEVTVNAPRPITAELFVNNIACNGQENGRAIANPTGGTIVDGSYDYEWSNGVFTRDNPALSAGTYSVMITDDNGCTEEFTTGVAEPEVITVSSIVTPADNGDNGSIELLPMGGTSPYFYTWQGRSDTSRVLDNLPFGNYVVSVTDVNNCEPVILEINVGSGFDCYDASDVITPQASPGLNDFLIIACIEQNPDNSLEIYNRWGQQVYSASGYDNTSVVFDGRSNKGNVLPEGGYFYVLRFREITTGNQQLLKGSFNLLR